MLKNFTLELRTEECVRCGVIFAVTATLQESLKEYGENFFCPHGHSMVYRKSTSTILKEQLEEERKKAAILNQEIAEMKKIKESKKKKNV